MSQPHVIRLNRAWELRVLKELPVGAGAVDDVVASVPSSARVDFPDGAEAEIFAGEAPLLLTRRFNRPSNLSPEQPVFLHIFPWRLGETAYFNGEALAPAARHDAEADVALHAISGQICESNRLDIVASDLGFRMELDVRLIIYEIPVT